MEQSFACKDPQCSCCRSLRAKHDTRCGPCGQPRTLPKTGRGCLLQQLCASDLCSLLRSALCSTETVIDCIAASCCHRPGGCADLCRLSCLDEPFRPRRNRLPTLNAPRRPRVVHVTDPCHLHRKPCQDPPPLFEHLLSFRSPTLSRAPIQSFSLVLPCSIESTEATLHPLIRTLVASSHHADQQILLQAADADPHQLLPHGRHLDTSATRQPARGTATADAWQRATFLASYAQIAWLSTRAQGLVVRWQGIRGLQRASAAVAHE
jgi:hypothetical protein